MSNDKIRVLLADDDELVRLSLTMIIEADDELTIAGQADSGNSAIAAYSALQPDVLLMDIRMQPMDGLAAGEVILQQHPRARILYLTTFADDDYIVRALRMGACGYILKQDYTSIAPSLKAVWRNQSVFGDTIMARIPALIQTPQTPDLAGQGLTDRESKIVQLVAEGLSNREIAARLNLGEGTVRNHLSVILDKLDLRDRTQLAIHYYKMQQA